MSSPTLLITGATGFIGFQVLLQALKEGHSVRVAIRSESQSDKIKSQLEFNGFVNLESRLSFCHVPDATAEGAYDQAVKGVQHIIHLAAPLPSPSLDPLTGIYEPTIKGVHNILISASGEPTVKKVVITASIFSVLSFPPDPSKELTAETRLSNPEGPLDDMMVAYNAGKVASLNAARNFVQTQRPAFEVVNILPGFAFGQDARAQKVEDMWSSTNALLLSAITGKTAVAPLPAGVGDVHDIAAIHVQSLKPDVVGDLGVVTGNVFNDAWDIVQREFPRAVEKGIFSRGHQSTVPVRFSSRKTETMFGVKLKSYEEMVKTVAAQYLELLGEDTV